MGWIWPLLVKQADDFWVNVFAGLPFLVFDLAIITLLLPKAIQWWDERYWRETRLRAANHLLGRYNDVEEALTRVLSVEDLSRFPSTAGFSIVGHDTILMALADHADAMDVELQTALPVLGPEMSQDMLGLHYDWKKFVRLFKEDGRISSNFPEEATGAQRTFVRLMIEATDLQVRYQSLCVKYAVDDLDISLNQSRPYPPLSSLSRAYAPVLSRLSEKRRGKAQDFSAVLRYAVVRLEFNLMCANKVRPFIRRTLWHWLKRRQQEPLIKSTPESRLATAREYDGLMERLHHGGAQIVRHDLQTGERTVLETEWDGN